MALIGHYVMLVFGIPTDLPLVLMGTGQVVYWAVHNKTEGEEGRPSGLSAQNGSSSNAGISDPDSNATLMQESSDPYDASTSSALPPPTVLSLMQQDNDSTIPILPAANRPRYYFLDNLKIFLTALVVTHHVSCAFGACGSGGWYLVIGDNDNFFTDLLKLFTLLNQGYFMTLFFLISGFFTPSSYDRKGPILFLQDKVKRILVPAVVCSFTISPLSLIVSQMTSGESFFYFPHAGVCWYLYWLFIFSFAYTTLADKNGPVEGQNRHQQTATDGLHEIAEERNENTTAPPSVNEPAISQFQFPSTKQRILKYGFLFCGIDMFAIMILAGFAPFYGMPITFGSLACDIVMFVAGITAKRYGVFDCSIAEQLDVSLPFLRSILIIEILGMITFGSFVLFWSPAWMLILVLVAGPYCVDMNLSLLQIFQVNVDSMSSLSRKLAKSAYTVYLVHPLIVVCVTAVYVEAYNALDGIQIQFADDSDDDFGEIDSDTDLGVGDTAMGWVMVNMLSHLICWPLAIFVSRIPCLQGFL